MDTAVFRRHANCRCLVEYDNGTGVYQNVHSKKKYNKSVVEDKKLIQNERVSYKGYKLGSRRNSESGNTVRYDLGKNELENIDKEIKKLNDLIRYDTVENAFVIQSNGKLIGFKSDSEISVEIFNCDLNGSTVLHNHPKANGITSFGGDDFEFLKNNQNIRNFLCSNPEFDYSMSALKDISNVSYSEYYHKAMLNMDLSKEVDFQHLVMIEIKKEGYIKYDRRRKK